MVTSLTLNPNVAALTVQRRLAQATAELDQSLQRLSSGTRINSSGDDAAGLAIREGLNADARVLAQGVRNLNDGISLLGLADGVMSEASPLVLRIRELAAAASNGTLHSKQRKALDDEAQSLAREFNRIARTASFNGQAILSRGFEELVIQAGYGAAGQIRSSLGGAVADGRFAAQAVMGRVRRRSRSPVETSTGTGMRTW